MIATLIIMFMAAAWMLLIGLSFKITGGGLLAAFVYKFTPVALSFGLLFIALGKIN